jgi:hypothetical protein
MCECLSIYVFVYLRVCEYEGVWGVLDRKLKGHVCVNVDYSFFTMHLNFLGLVFFVQVYTRMTMY